MRWKTVFALGITLMVPNGCVLADLVQRELPPPTEPPPSPAPTTPAQFPDTGGTTAPTSAEKTGTDGTVGGDDGISVLNANLQPGETFLFDSYGGDALEWRVLDSRGGNALIITEYVVDARRYNVEFIAATWDSCTLRAWLNEDFYNAAFGADEKSRIMRTMVVNRGNSERGTPGGVDTEDLVFLLSEEEAHMYFGDGAGGVLAKAQATPYAASGGVRVMGAEANAYWWLRSPGHHEPQAMYVDNGGKLQGYVGEGVSFATHGVRPAMWIELPT